MTQYHDPLHIRVGIINNGLTRDFTWLSVRIIVTDSQGQRRVGTVVNLEVRGLD